MDNSHASADKCCGHVSPPAAMNWCTHRNSDDVVGIAIMHGEQFFTSKGLFLILCMRERVISSSLRDRKLLPWQSPSNLFRRVFCLSWAKTVFCLHHATRNITLRWKQNKTHCLVLVIKSRTLNLRKPPTYQPIEHSERVLLMYFEPMQSSW